MNFVEKTQLAAVETTGTESSACMSKQVIEFVSEKKKKQRNSGSIYAFKMEHY